LVRWNMNKRYLHALGEQGAQVLPSIVVEAGAPLPLEQVSQAGWTDVVVKPLVGASAWQIARTRTTELAQAITPELRLHGYLIQPFLPEVAEGEYSLVFLEGEFSHMAVKKPQAGDFRVQHELGGSLQRADADVAMIEAAASLFALFPVSPVYASTLPSASIR
jgi:glutathione synthase/RimK-type ligase-like ATP-grasp enzyme